MRFYDTISNMKAKYLLFITLFFSGCSAHYIAPNTVEAEAPECIDSECQIIDVYSPAGNDLVVETPRHIVHVTATPDVRYEYRVWAGGAGMTTAPDVIVHDGDVMILTDD